MDTTCDGDTNGDEQMETHNAGKYSDRTYTECRKENGL